MKKLLAAAMAVFTAAGMAGCNTTADNQLIDEIAEDTSNAAEVSETAEISGMEETASVSETETSVEDAVLETETESDNEPRLAQQEDLIGAWISTMTYAPISDPDSNVLGEGITLFTDSTVKAFFRFGCVDFKYTIKDGKPVLNGNPDPNIIDNNDSGYYTISEDTLYFTPYEESEPIYSYRRYEHEPVTLDYFYGQYISKLNEMGVAVIYDDISILYDGDIEIKLSIKEVNGDKVIIAMNGEEAEYSYYIVETGIMDRYIYFVNDQTSLILLFFDE